MGVQLEGNKAKPEPIHFRVMFPGGDVDIVRTTDGEYWVHVRRNRPEDVIAGGGKVGHITDARLDILGMHSAEANTGDFANPNLYHLAVRVGTGDDPHIAMRTIRVLFEESKYNYQTNINGTRKEIADYFRGAPLNVASYPEEVMRTAKAIEFVGQDIKLEL